MLSSPVVERVVIDTNIFVSALMNAAGAPRAVLRLVLKREVLPVIGNALFNEYESLLKRDNLWKDSLLKGSERERLFDALLSASAWTPIYYLWRPNLRDESDNHLIELAVAVAVAAGAETIITANKRDFADSELLFPQIRIETAGEFLDQRKTI